MDQNIIHVTVAVLIVLAAVTPIQNFLAKSLGFSDTSIIFNIVYASVLIGIFFLVRHMIKTKENFFFEVANDSHCHGAFSGRPATFQFTQVGSGDCKPLDYPPLGMIADVKSCTYGSSQGNPYQPGISYVDNDANFM